MIPIQPFRALRPSAARAREFSVPRLDHLGEAATAAIEARLPKSLAAVLGQGGSALLAELEQAKGLLRHAEPTFYMHRQVRGSQRCAGLVACLPAEAFTAARVRPHREACERRGGAWREQLRRLGAQVDPVIVGFEPTEAIVDLFEREMNERPLFHVVADDGATHTLWSGTRAPALQEAFAAVSHAYLLEGHHRVMAAEGEMVSALLLPLAQVQARWSIRVVEGEAGARAAMWISANAREEAAPGAPPEGFADACVITGGVPKWFRLELPAAASASPRAATHDRRLDALLERHAGATGVHRAGEEEPARIEALAAEAGAVAIVLPAPKLEEITRLADAGVRLPVGSTWFAPRIRSGLWIA